MAVSEGPSTGPVRPIPIHLMRLPETEDNRFKFPFSLEKPSKSAPTLWNPALDLCTASRENASAKSESEKTKKPSFSSSRPLSLTSPTLSSSLSISVVQTSTTRSSAVPAASVKSPRTPPPTLSGVLKAAPMMNTLIHDQLQRRIPSGLDNPLAVLASKGLFPTLFSSPGSILAHSAPPVVAVHPQLSLTLPERHMAFQNALAVAHSRAVMERMTSNHPTISRGTLNHPQQSHSFHISHNQQNLQQLSPNAPQPSIPHLQQPMLAPERPISLHGALALAQSRALVERVCNNPVLAPVISIDNNVVHSYGRKFFPCPQCRYTTDRRNNLKRHMLTMHQTSSKMLECCGILFNTKASLREHAMIFHYHGYTCYFCGRRFCRKALLKRHLSVHNGQKDFVCNVCDYATSHKSNLERHRKVHSRQDEGKDGDMGQHYHDDVKSNGSEAVSHDDVSSDELSVCSDYDDTDVEINVHSD